MRGRSTLFLMEQIVVITVFAICTALCVYILSESYLLTVNAVDTRNALLAAESAAECFKAYGGDMGKIAEVLKGKKSDTGVYVYYDGNWRPNCYNSYNNITFVLHLDIVDNSQPIILANIAVGKINVGKINFGRINVGRISAAEDLVRLSVAARER